jgi:hypothetical protein
MEDELIQLILEGQVQARIDSQNKVNIHLSTSYPFSERSELSKLDKL